MVYTTKEKDSKGYKGPLGSRYPVNPQFRGVQEVQGSERCLDGLTLVAVVLRRFCLLRM